MTIPKDFRDRLIHVHYCSKGDYSFLHTLLSIDPELTFIYDRSEIELRLYFKRRKSLPVDKDVLRSLPYSKILHYLDDNDIVPITKDDPVYPRELAYIHDAPYVLYVKGNIELLQRKHKLSVVGTRHPSPMCQSEIDVLLPVAKQGIVLVSGLAIGVDQLVHQTAIKANGHTIAVLGFGHDHTYPLAIASLKRELMEKQLVISEYPPYVAPVKYRFPERNRIIAGLSKATFVIEAKARSGSLITANLALEQGKDVYALPGRIFEENSLGTNYLISLGAKIILHESSILEEFV
ncbi:DNA-protecting protein DprA [Paenalkalicoccus suaedae]|uniref:DNA-protecting protein DprA n=1 Tax=Paenalkalicoccus suaedae TaxID=2592382 RepID=A0A859FF09_9BACI|nr:DNA-processing protein DprA [Paenalkalicoccus suaedae]QKS71450.1 DNA-protecting protein DprA [Paenalkalicoccus suaedae]